ncbi:hypothetical protein ARMGADRAFT_1081050 [Armillaria gallica]|uniref:Uncharacterized protein n=1 Tax=Armillaria gallica TaxID=47427 RepID=A0A2H3DLC7_ARMGA|nr:hypothetical protein ARMGADRAFT_1081050 [Armillaria gallica]
MDDFNLDLNANHFPDAPSLNLNAVTPYFNPADSASPTNRSDDIDEDAILSLMISNGIMDYPSDMFYPDLTEKPVATSTRVTLSPTFSISLASSSAPECALHSPPFTETPISVDNPIQNIASFSSTPPPDQERIDRNPSPSQSHHRSSSTIPDTGITSIDAARKIVMTGPDDADNENDTGGTTWASRNPGYSRIPLREKSMNHGTATKASILQLKKRNKEKRKEYNNEIVTIKSYIQKEVQHLADKYDQSQDAVQFDVHSSTLFKPQRKFSLEDAKVAEMALLHNTDRPVGQKFRLKELKALAQDHIDYQSMTKDEEKAPVQRLEDQRQIKLRSVCINNIAAGADFRKTGTHIGQEINNLGV